MRAAPAICNNCGLTFESPFNLGNSINSAVIGCATSCPRCGSNAQVMNSFTDSKGQLHVQGFFNHLRNYKDEKKLKDLKQNIEDTQITPTELAEALVELDPSFSSFSAVIKTLPQNKFNNLLPTLISILTLLIMLLTWNSDKESQEELLELQRSQLELSREQYDYQKNKDKKEELEKQNQANHRDEIEKQIDDLRTEFERKLKDALSSESKESKQNSLQKMSSVKGNLRNKPCVCGSGLKSKKCHPYGF